MAIKIIKDKISLEKLKALAKEFYGTMVKGVADIERNVVAFGGEYHMDTKIVECYKRFLPAETPVFHQSHFTQTIFSAIRLASF